MTGPGQAPTEDEAGRAAESALTVITELDTQLIQQRRVKLRDGRIGHPCRPSLVSRTPDSRETPHPQLDLHVKGSASLTEQLGRVHALRVLWMRARVMNARKITSGWS